jgi:hypothetical protein
MHVAFSYLAKNIDNILFCGYASVLMYYGRNRSVGIPVWTDRW